MSGWQRDYYFTEEISDKLFYILDKGANLYNDFVDTVEGEFPEISSFHTDEFSVYLSTDDERFEEIQRGVRRMINKKYKELLHN